jgi:hypothetical protein
MHVECQRDVCALHNNTLLEGNLDSFVRAVQLMSEFDLALALPVPNTEFATC